MNNKETLDHLHKLFKNIDPQKIASVSMRFFGLGGGTKLLAQNQSCLTGMSHASVDKALMDLEKGEITFDRLPAYVAMLGVASGLTLGVYLMAEAFGLTEQILEGAEMTQQQVDERLEAGKQKYSKPDRFKVDSSLN